MKRKYVILIVIFLIVASLAAFGRILGNDFINFDDDKYIYKNSHIQSGINPESIKWAFATTVLDNWVPLAMISHMLDWSLFGANASGHHIVSLFLHIGTVIFLFFFLNKTTNNLWLSAFATAFFALHPLRVESVAWAAERKDVLSMFFGMATLYVYAFYAEKPKLSRYFLCLILFLLSLLSKSMLITLPFVLLLLDYWPLGRWQEEIITPNKNILFNRLIGEKLPFLLLTVISSIITFLIQHEAGSVYPSLFVRISNAIVAYATYLGKTFWPVDLTLVYHVAYSFPAWQIIVSCFIMISITIIVISRIKKLSFLFVGWFWYLGTLFPVIGLVPTNALIADHYTYLPSIGIAVMLSWGIPFLIKNEESKNKILFPAAIFVLAILSVLTFRQCGYWKNSMTLFNYALQVTKDNYLAHNNRGSAYITLGQYQQAIEDFSEAIRLRPDLVESYNNRGSAYNALGQYQPALEDFNEAIRLRPDLAESYNNRGSAYNALGQYQPALEDFNEAIRLNPYLAEAYKNRGGTYAKLNSYQQAIENYNEAIRLKPDYIKAYYDRGTIYGNLGQYQLAIEDFNEAIRLNPDFAEAYYNRGITYSHLGQYQKATEDFNEALRLKPDDADTLNNRGFAYLKQGDKISGCRDAKKACELGKCITLEDAKSKVYCH